MPPRRFPKHSRLENAQRRLIWRLKQAGNHTQAEIAHFAECDQSTVSRCTGPFSPPRRIPPRPARDLPSIRRKILRQMMLRAHYSVSVSQLVRDWNRTVKTNRRSRAYGVTLTPTTCRRDLEALGYVNRARPRHAAFHEDDPETRVRFCMMIFRTPSCHARYLCFSDEKWFDINDHGSRRMWIQRGAEVRPRLQGGRFVPKVHVFGMIGVGWRFLHIFDAGQNVDSTVYIAYCLNPISFAFRSNPDLWLVQDNARAHTSLLTRTAAARLGIPLLPGWPARSPDLNPIENLWGVLQRAVSNRGPSDRDELVRFVRAEWRAIPQNTIDHLVESFDGRVQRLLQQGGAHL